MQQEGNMDPEVIFIRRTIYQVLTGIVLMIMLSMYGCPQYNVWQQGLAGQAELRRAEQNRQIRVQEAHAHMDSAKLLASAEVERSKGVAEANKIVAEGLGGPEGYLRYLYIQQLGNAEKNERTIIYVPTEGLLPVTEAGRAVPR
jgi:hypothetical protein